MSGPVFTVTHRGVVWTMQALTVAGTWITCQVRDRRVSMPCSALEFSLWDATCKQIPDMVLTDATVELLRPWLEAAQCRWRLGWGRKRAKPAERQPDPRQLSLPWEE